MISIKNISSYNNLINFDKSCDYIPFVSTVTNLVDLFQKCVVMRFMKPEDIQKSHYYTHLQKKELRVCVALLIPVLGNILVFLYQRAVKKLKDQTLQSIKLGVPGAKVPEDLRSDRKFILEAVKSKYEIFKEASDELKKDPSFVLEVIKVDYRAIEYAAKELTGSPDFMLKAVKIDYRVAEKIPDELTSEPKFSAALYKELRGNADFMLEEIKKDHNAIKDAAKELQGDLKFMLKAVEANYQVANVLSVMPMALYQELKGNASFMLQEIIRNPNAIEILSDSLKKNREYMIQLIELAGAHLILKDAFKELRKEPEFLVDAAKRNYNVAYYVDDAMVEKLSNHEDFMLAAIRAKKRSDSGTSAVNMISAKLKQNPDFMLKVLEVDPTSFEGAHFNLRSNKAFMLKAIQIDPAAANYIPHYNCDLRSDPEFAAKLQEIRASGLKKVL